MMRRFTFCVLAVVCLTSFIPSALMAEDHPDVVAADKLLMEDYTVPSYVLMMAAREAARAEASEQNLQNLQSSISNLQSKHEPYCVVATINGDPKTHMGFCWFTNDGIEEGQVELTDGEGNVSYVSATPKRTGKLKYLVAKSGIADATGLTNKTSFYYISHKALAQNLTPGTTYSYRVGYEGHWSKPYTFTTAKEEQGDFSFVYMTDSHLQNQVYIDNARICAEAVANNEEGLAFCTFPGDFVETGTVNNTEWEWERWFEESFPSVIAKMPFVPTDGNHDDTKNLNYTWHFNADNAFNQRSLVVKPQFEGIVYSFVYGDVLFLVYSMQDYWRQDSENKRISAMDAAYLRTDLGNWFREQVTAHPECKYRVSLCHKNIFSGSGHQEDEETPLFRAMMLPIFADCQIDLALQGHDHCYEVIGPVEPWTRTVVPGSVTGTTSVSKNSNTNMTGLEGGTYCVDEGTLYFIGATCGRKRYYPYTRAQMDAQKDITKMDNYYDLFTGKFGQPEAPSYTRVNVSDEGLELKTYAVDAEGHSNEYNTIRVVRTKEHTPPTGFNNPQSTIHHPQGVYDLMGNRYDKVPGQGMYIVVNQEGSKTIYIQ